MSPRVALLVVAVVSVAAGGCGISQAPAPTPAAPTPVAVTPAPASPVGAVKAPPTPQGQPLVPPTPPVPQTQAPAYDAKGRRDPFVEITTVSGASGLSVSSTKLTGIVRSGRSALALVETVEGIGYILKPGDTLGDGRLVEIGADTVVFAVGPKPGFPPNRVVLRLAAN